MARRSHREIAASLRRRLSSDRLVSACLVVEEPDGTEIIRAGGLWDPSLQRYVDPIEVGVELELQRIRVQVSQVPLMRGLARWIEQSRRGEQPRPVVVMAGGQPGSGKTFAIAGIFCHLVALEWPGDEQFASNLNSDNRRECLHHMQLVGRSGWTHEVEDPRKAHVAWCNGSRLTWVSARNEKKLRQRGLPIRHVLINEAQLQPDTLYATAQQAGRSLGGLCTITMNPPTNAGGNWTSRLWFAIQAGEVKGEVYQMDSADNAAVDHSYIDAAGDAIRAAAPRLASAEVDGVIQIAGTLAYPSFDGRPYDHASPLDGGNVGEPPLPPQVGQPLWQNVTHELTAKSIKAQLGFDRAIGCDFQKRPGIVGNVAEFYRLPPGRPCPLCGPGGCLVMYVSRQVACRGVEPEFSQAIIDAGFSTNGFMPSGERAASAMLVGDKTGAHQNSEHKFAQPASFLALRADGWTIRPPAYHWKSGKPWNPDVLESLAQMFELFRTRHILVSPRCKQPAALGIASLIESLKNAPRWEHSGKLKDEGGYQHGPDGLRYLSWAFMPRPKPIASDTTPDLSVFGVTGKKRSTDLGI